MRPHTFCSYCGVRYSSETWPRTCEACLNTTWRNPIPVAALLVRASGGLLVVRRNIEPAKGSWALPGGYVDFGETWQEAAVRELREEAGVVLTPNFVRLVDILNSSHGNILIFGSTPEVDLPKSFTPNSEVSEIKVIHAPEELAFPTQTQMAARFFASKNNHWVM